MKDYSKEPWWNALTRKEKEELLRMEPTEGQESPEGIGSKHEQISEGKEELKPKKCFKAKDLFGWG